MTADVILDARKFSVGYSRPLFSAADLTLNAGELVSLIGPNGTGKSSLLKCFAGLLPPLTGTLRLCGIPFENWSVRQRASQVASVFTHLNLPYGMTVREFVSLGRIPFSGFLDKRSAADERAVDMALEEVGMANFAHRMLQTLSDGERSRIFVARAVASEPKLLLLDEPTAFLDVPNILQLFRFLKRLAGEKGVAVLLSTHHVEKAMQFSDRIIALNGKGFVSEDSPAALKDSFLNWAYEG